MLASWSRSFVWTSTFTHREASLGRLCGRRSPTVSSDRTIALAQRRERSNNTLGTNKIFYSNPRDQPLHVELEGKIREQIIG
jgi:hypothetical protein